MPTNGDKTYILLLPKRVRTPKLGLELQSYFHFSYFNFALSVNRQLFKGFVSFGGSEDLFLKKQGGRGR